MCGRGSMTYPSYLSGTSRVRAPATLSTLARSLALWMRYLPGRRFERWALKAATTHTSCSVGKGVPFLLWIARYPPRTNVKLVRPPIHDVCLPRK